MPQISRTEDSLSDAEPGHYIQALLVLTVY